MSGKLQRNQAAINKKALRIIDLLRGKSISNKDLCAAMIMTKSSVSQYLYRLTEASVVYISGRVQAVRCDGIRGQNENLYTLTENKEAIEKFVARIAVEPFEVRPAGIPKPRIARNPQPADPSHHVYIARDDVQCVVHRTPVIVHRDPLVCMLFGNPSQR